MSGQIGTGGLWDLLVIPGAVLLAIGVAGSVLCAVFGFAVIVIWAVGA